MPASAEDQGNSDFHAETHHSITADKAGTNLAEEQVAHSASTVSSMAYRLQFLLTVVEDTQNTIRFLDTKAAFCVTLVSGLAAVTLSRVPPASLARHILLSCFLAGVILTLLICLRVIFPTIKPSGIPDQITLKFYVGHNKAHHWLLHTFANPVDDVLSENQSSYMRAIENATDNDLLASITDSVLKTALIRQVKTDRLHAAMFTLVATIFFGGLLILI